MQTDGQIIDHAQIAQRIPHAGRMCLLERAVAWDELSITAVAVSHTDLANPLRHAGQLSSLCAIEYAGQATALHGSLASNDGRAQVGYLASVRDVALQRTRLDDLREPLEIFAQRRGGNEAMMLYEFTVHCAKSLIASGRLAVSFVSQSP
jgi:predicted hotdog family 3-hydroxylacyl-ACP dehydratase